jgi:hypothetical protein
MPKISTPLSKKEKAKQRWEKIEKMRLDRLKTL